MNRIFYILLFFAVLSVTGCFRGNDAPGIRWDNGLVLPPSNGMPENIGLAGAFAGFADGKLIVAGGANFPDGMPWDGGVKKWWDTMYALDTLTGEWSVHENFLKKESAYGLSFQLDDGILCVGGCDASQCHDDVFLITYAHGEPRLVYDRFPQLPAPVANAAGAILDGKVYIAGGQQTMTDGSSVSVFLMLDTAAPEKGWQELPTWPGPSRGYAVGAAQQGKIYIFGGRSYGPQAETTVYNDCFAYAPATRIWEQQPGDPVIAGSAMAYGNDKILLLGGADKMLPTTPDHPGFSRTARLYDPATGRSSVISESPYPVAVTVTTVSSGDDFYIASGEIRPGVRTPHLLKGTVLRK